LTRKTVVFVCTGNTCRSPLAMALARRRWPQGRFVSAGLQALAGQPAADHARLVAAERGADLEGHRSQGLDATLLHEAAWVIGMTRSHVAMLNRALGDGVPVRIGLLGAPCRDLRGQPTPDEEEVADPIGGSLETYRTTADQLERLLRGWEDVLGAAGPGREGGPQ